jgi:hypothetical protein
LRIKDAGRVKILDCRDEPKVRLPQALGEASQRDNVAHSSAEFPGKKNCFHERRSRFDLTKCIVENYLA